MNLKSGTNLFVFFMLMHISARAFNDSIPKFTVKWAPVALLDFDPNVQVHFEYFLTKKTSLEASYGFGNKNLLNWSQNDSMNQFRLQFRNYLGTYSTIKRGRSYWATELMYKNVLQPEVAVKESEPYDQDLFRVNVNVGAMHLIFGHQYISSYGFPVFDIFVGLGIRAYQNKNIGLQPGYSFQYYTMFNRLAGSGKNASLLLGIALGLGR